MAKIRKQFILDDKIIKKARKALGVHTDTEAVTLALNMVVANAEIWEAHQRIAGRLNIHDMDQSRFK